MSWFVGIFCFIITFVTWGIMENRRQETSYNEALDLMELCETVYKHSGYYDLKRDRKQLLEIEAPNTGRLQGVYMKMLVDTLHYIDARLAEFSAEEKAIYDAVYGG